MTSIADIGTFIFGTYDADFGQNLAGHRLAVKASEATDPSSVFKGASRAKATGFGNIFVEAGDITKDQLDELISAKKGLRFGKKHSNFIADDLTNLLKSKGAIAQGETITQAAAKRAATQLGTNVDDLAKVSLGQMVKTNMRHAIDIDPVRKIFTKSGRSAISKGISKTFKGGSVLKGLAKGSGRALPLVGAVLALGFEIPRIVKSFSNYGAGEGVKATVNAAGGLTGAAAGMSVGAAIGTAILPVGGTIIGGMIGAIAGDFLGRKVAKVATGDLKINKQENLEMAGVPKEQAIAIVKQGANEEQIVQMAQQQQAPNNFFAQQQFAPAYANPYMNSAYSNPYMNPAYANQFNSLTANNAAVFDGGWADQFVTLG